MSDNQLVAVSFRPHLMAGAGYFVAAGGRQCLEPRRPASGSTSPALAWAARAAATPTTRHSFGNVVAICDVDRNTLEKKGKLGEVQKRGAVHRLPRTASPSTARTSTSVTISTPDHMHAPATLDAMRLGISCYTQKPLTRTIYEARLLAKVANEMAGKGVCTQMGNQGTATRHVPRSNRPAPSRACSEPSKRSTPGRIVPSGPRARIAAMNMRKYQTQAMSEVDESGGSDDDCRGGGGDRPGPAQEEAAGDRQGARAAGLEKTGSAWHHRGSSGPASTTAFQHRGWWDFGTGALGDMACHQLTVPFASCGLRDPISVVAKTTGHDFDSFPASSIIKFEFPETSERPAIPFWWYDRKGNKPPAEIFCEVGYRQGLRQRRAGRGRQGRLL